MSRFDEIIDRRGTDSYKWDTTAPGVTPMWVADMDFRTAPCIIEALKRRVERGVFGYTAVPERYYRAIRHWFERRHGWIIDTDKTIYTPGVVPALSAIIKAMTRPGDKIICQTPAYNCFFSSIRNNGCILAANPLAGSEGEGFSIDYDNLENLASDPAAKLLILCNPHNPSGRVWTADELQRVADICLRHDMFVISDEIHCELTYPGHDYTPFATVAPEGLRWAACFSPSKAFNIAGLQIANILACNEDIMARIDRAVNDNEVCDVNPFGVIATVEAYENGAEWLDELRDYLWGNYQYLKSVFSILPQYPVAELQGTYLVWLNISASGMSADQLEALLEDRAAVRPASGSIYGSNDHLRINIACPRSVLANALDRMVPVLEAVSVVK